MPKTLKRNREKRWYFKVDETLKIEIIFSLYKPQRKALYMSTRKKIALVAHDQRKQDLVDWVRYNEDKLAGHEIWATGTTGTVIEEHTDLEINKLKSGPLGGDQQLGAMIANSELDMLFFFWDPMTAQPHDVDVKALLRMSVLYNVVTACNRATADFMISSGLFDQPYAPIVKDYGKTLKHET